MMADGTTESLFLALPTYDHSKRIRRENHLSTFTVQNSFSYSSGLELNSRSSGLLGATESNISFIEPSQYEGDMNFSGNRGFETFYDTLGTNGYSTCLGLANGYQGSARSIQNGRFTSRSSRVVSRSRSFVSFVIPLFRDRVCASYLLTTNSTARNGCE